MKKCMLQCSPCINVECINTPWRFREFIVAFGSTTTVHFQDYELTIISTTYLLSTILNSWLFDICFPLVSDFSVPHCILKIFVCSQHCSIFDDTNQSYMYVQSRFIMCMFMNGVINALINGIMNYVKNNIQNCISSCVKYIIIEV